MLFPVAGVIVGLVVVWWHHDNFTVPMDYVMWSVMGLTAGVLVLLVSSGFFANPSEFYDSETRLQPFWGEGTAVLLVEDLDEYTYVAEGQRSQVRSARECDISVEGPPRMSETRSGFELGWLTLSFPEVRECTIYAPDSLIVRSP